MWYESMKEFNCKISFVCVVYGRSRDHVCTWRHLIRVKRRSNRNCITSSGSMRRNDTGYIRNDERTWRNIESLYHGYDDKERRAHKKSSKDERKKKWTGWKSKFDEQTLEFQKKKMDKNDDTQDDLFKDDTEDDLPSFQRHIEITIGKKKSFESQSTKRKSHNCNITEWQTTWGYRCKIHPPKIKRKVFKKKVRTVRTEHMNKYDREKKKITRKLLTELYKKGSLKTEMNDESNFEVITTKCAQIRRKKKKVQESRFEYFKKKGNHQFTDDERSAETTVALVLQVRSKRSDNKNTRFEDAFVDEIIKKFMERSAIIEKLSKIIDDSDDSFKLKEDRDIVIMRNPDASPTIGIKSHRVKALTSMMSKWYAFCVTLRLKREKKKGLTSERIYILME